MKRSELRRRVSLHARNGIKPVTRSKQNYKSRDQEVKDACTMAQTLPYACYLAEHGINERTIACGGGLVRCHLIPKQVLRREVWGQRDTIRPLLESRAQWFPESLAELVWHPAVWVWGCGGLNGSSGHHGQLDVSRTLRLPRAAIPEATEQLAAELGLTWYLDREYGTPDTEAEAA